MNEQHEDQNKQNLDKQKQPKIQEADDHFDIILEDYDLDNTDDLDKIDANSL